MGTAVVHSRALVGIEAAEVRVEVHIGGGLPRISIVGLPEKSVNESRERVRAALKNAGCEIAPSHIVINLSPADLPKAGSRFDLPIAIGILAASKQILPESVQGREFIGELALTGELRSVRGVLAAASACRHRGRELIAPQANALEIALAAGSQGRAASNLRDVCRHLSAEEPLPPVSAAMPQRPLPAPAVDMAEIRGQQQARRAVEVAAAGMHNLLMVGPPGAGKSMIAAAVPGILPPLETEEALETAAILSLSEQGFSSESFGVRPFRSPHHTASGTALVGGGTFPKPGEISLAHNGVLFLDEFPEFSRPVLEALREPLETGYIDISRARAKARFPARIQLVAAMNPCPCGHGGDNSGLCRCPPPMVERYRARLSGPLLDRIDMQIHMPRIELGEIQRQIPSESSELVRNRVIQARQRQLERAGKPNSQLDSRELETFCHLGDAGEKLLNRVSSRLRLSMRACNKAIKVARTLADLDSCEKLHSRHLAEALGYRSL